MECEPNNNFDIFQLVRQFEEMIQSGIDIYLEEHQLQKLMDYYVDEHEYANAGKVAREAVRQYPYNLNFRVQQIELYYQLRELDHALNGVEGALLIAPFDFEVQLLKVRILIAQKEINEAMTILETLKNGADNEEFSQIYFLEGLVHEALEDYEEMFESLRFSLLCYPVNEKSLRKIWVAAEMINAFDESIVLHNKIINEEPYSYLAWYNLGQAYSCVGDYEKALNAYEYAYLIEPDFELGYQDRGDLLFELGRYAEALECYKEWYELTGPDAELMILIAHCHLKLNNFDKARRIFKKAKRLDPYNDEVYYLIGRCHYEKEEYLSAIHQYQKALRLENLREEYYAAMGSAYCRLGEFTKSHYYYQKAEEVGPEQTYIWKKHGLFLYSIGEHEEAFNVLNEGIDNTMDTELMYCKAALLVKSDRIEEAMYTLEEALVERYDGQETFHQILHGIDLDHNIQSLLRFFAPQSG
ncbi:tetratricopeptide repeat protein [Membranicola marinus]|uniref:Tetratricopeptide repeat protein n=1 Tax=Membranihabitans marinus TaxID=1227546 RepID=A0A953HIY3_9BACT|nr:tetratricopeptide repeat protein [Membranihabitans marinus]MBY5956557.1 tetratricopeptide repeat protein [Membranihabitans marinus]